MTEPRGHKHEHKAAKRESLRQGWKTGDADIDAVIAELRAENERLRSILESIPNIVSYVVATLSPTTLAETEWAEVHRGRSGSSIRQPQNLERRAREVLGDD